VDDYSIPTLAGILLPASHRHEHEHNRSLPAHAGRTQEVAGMNIRAMIQGNPIAKPYSGRERHAAPPHARNFRIEESATELSTISAKPLPAASPKSKFWGADTDLPDLPESDNELDASSVEARTPVTDTWLKEFLWKPASDSTSWQAVSHHLSHSRYRP
jgi:hypothetical protein